MDEPSSRLKKKKGGKTKATREMVCLDFCPASQVSFLLACVSGLQLRRVHRATIFYDGGVQLVPLLVTFWPRVNLVVVSVRVLVVVLLLLLLL